MIGLGLAKEFLLDHMDLVRTNHWDVLSHLAANTPGLDYLNMLQLLNQADVEYTIYNNSAGILEQLQKLLTSELLWVADAVARDAGSHGSRFSIENGKYIHQGYSTINASMRMIFDRENFEIFVYRAFITNAYFRRTDATVHYMVDFKNIDISKDPAILKILSNRITGTKMTAADVEADLPMFKAIEEA